MGKTGARIFSAVFVVVGALVLAHGVKMVFTARESEGWPTARGRVVASAVEPTRSDKGRTSYRAEILFEYDVNGQTQSSHDVGFISTGSSNPSLARSLVNKYPAGSTVTVHYSPTHPEKGVLEPGLKGETFLLPGFGAIFLAAGLAMFILVPRSIDRAKARGAAAGRTVVTFSAE